MWLTADDLPRRMPRQFGAALVIGDEPLLVEESGDLLRRAAREQGFTERQVLEAGKGFNWDALTAEASAMSLFGDRQLIEIRIPEAKPGNDGSKALQEFLAAQSPDVGLLVLATTTNAPPKDAAWMVRIAEAGVGVRCRKVRSEKLPRWLAGRAQGLGLQIEPQALAWLAEQVEGNLLAARQELERLPLLGSGPWDVAALEAVVGDHARYAGYDLPDALLAGELASALRMAERLREEGVAPAQLMFSLARDMRSLLAAAQRAGQLGPEQACQAVGIWRNRQGRFAAALRRHGLQRIRQLHLLVVGLDRTAKSAPEAQFWQELVNFAVRLAGPTRRAA